MGCGRQREHDGQTGHGGRVRPSHIAVPHITGDDLPIHPLHAVSDHRRSVYPISHNTITLHSSRRLLLPPLSHCNICPTTNVINNYTSQAHVAVGRAHVPDLLALVWLAQYAPDSSTYPPLYVASRLLPDPWIRGAMHQYDANSAWWNFAAVGNYAARFYSFAMGEKGLVRRTQRELQKRLQQTVKVLEKQVGDSSN